jgi:hypothetical protein
MPALAQVDRYKRIKDALAQTRNNRAANQAVASVDPGVKSKKIADYNAGIQDSIDNPIQ